MTAAGSDSSGKKPNVKLIAVFSVLAALVVGVGIGAFAYREYRADKNTAKNSASPADLKQSSKEVALNKIAPVIGSDTGKSKLSDKYEAQFTTSTMWPQFRPEQHSYVSRCVPGRVWVQVRSKPNIKVKVWGNPAASGRYRAEARPLPGQDFSIQITPDGGSAETYKIRCLPADFPEWRYKQFKKPPKGMFMVSTFTNPGDRIRPWMMVFDQEGTPRWWFSPPTNSLGGQVLDDGTFQVARGFSDGFGKDARTAIDIRQLNGKLNRTLRFQGAQTDGHEYFQLPNGNALVMSYKPRYGVDLRSVGGRANRGVLDGAIQEVTPSGKVVWEWNSKDHIGLDQTPERWWERAWRNPHFDEQGRIRYDIFHLNSIDPWRDMYVISTRHTDAVWGISKKTGEVIWKFGGVPSDKSLKVIGDDPYGGYPLSGNHDARMVGDVLTVHDNGVKVEGRPSRAVSYRINLKDRTATFVGELRDEEVSGSGQCCGSFRKFGDGWLVGWGAAPWVTGFTHDRQRAFVLGISVPPYRAVPLPEGIGLADLEAGLEDMEPVPAIADSSPTPLDFSDRHNLEDKSIPGRKLGPNPDEKQADLDQGIGVAND